MNGKNRFFVSIMSTLLLEQLWNNIFADPLVNPQLQTSVIATKTSFKGNQQGILAQSDSKDANSEEDDQQNDSNQPTLKQRSNFEKNAQNSANGKQEELWNQIISLGKQNENQNQLYAAMACYRAAAVIDKKKTKHFIVALKGKMKNKIETNKSQEEIYYLEQGVKKGNAEDAYELGKLYFRRNEINKAIKMWETASQYKHSKAPYRLAVMFEKGEIVPLDLAKAEYYYKVGSNNGHPKCSYIVAKLLELEAHRNPQNAKRVMDQSFKLKQEAADRGHSLAAAEIGYIYASKGDHIKAKRYFEKSYKHAKPEATITLNLKKLMRYHIASEEYQISNSLKDSALIYY